MYVARTRNGFVPASRRQVFSKLKHLVAPTCPFVNLPETRRSRFGEELNAEKMKKAIWLRPESVAQIEFLEWTEGDRKSTRLNSSHVSISYAVLCLKKKSD